jgi:hypothetical protein
LFYFLFFPVVGGKSNVMARAIAMFLESKTKTMLKKMPGTSYLWSL